VGKNRLLLRIYFLFIVLYIQNKYADSVCKDSVFYIYRYAFFNLLIKFLKYIYFFPI